MYCKYNARTHTHRERGGRFHARTHAYIPREREREREADPDGDTQRNAHTHRGERVRHTYTHTHIHTDIERNMGRNRQTLTDKHIYRHAYIQRGSRSAHAYIRTRRGGIDKQGYRVGERETQPGGERGRQTTLTPTHPERGERAVGVHTRREGMTQRHPEVRGEAHRHA